jgi:glycosyltransferase involved in cell wall biosynthesis
MNTGMSKSNRLVVAVDLLPLRPGGENGGIKPAIFGLLRAVRHEAQDSLVFVFLTNSASHSQVRALAGPNDLLVCVLEEPQHPFEESPAKPNEYKLTSAPPNLVEILEADLLYCPFGATTFHVPGVPTIAMVADFLHRDYPFTLTKVQINEREAYLQKTVRDATFVQCISRSGMERAAAHYQLPPSRLFYTYLPIHDRLGDVRSDIRTASAPLSPERPFFFYPANLWLHKNHEVLLLSYSRYRHLAKDEAWDLVLTFHEEPRADYLRGLADTLGCSDRVRFLGFLTESELHQIWLRAGALIFPSQHEGFGIPLLEAMHYGVPIVTGDQYSLREVAGDACYRVDPRKPVEISEALRLVSQDRPLREKLIKTGRERLALFEVKVAARILFDTFSSVVRNEDSFPRRPRYAHEPPFLAAPTPASSAAWEIEILYENAGSQKCFVYLDPTPFGSFAPSANAEGKFSFVCRPEGRLLALRLDRSRHEKEGRSDDGRPTITRIVATQSEGSRILLYEKEPARALT